MRVKRGSVLNRQGAKVAKEGKGVMMEVNEYHPHNNDKVLDRLIDSGFVSSSMNDAKWVRLLDALTENEDLILECHAKLVWDQELRHFAIDGITHYQFDYWEHAVEALISGTPRGWYAYKEIEWIDFPAHSVQHFNPSKVNASTREVNQDLDAIARTINQAGQFDVEQNINNLRLYAYRRPS